MSHQYLTLDEAADRLNRSIGDLFNLGDKLPFVAVITTNTTFLATEHSVRQLGDPKHSVYKPGFCVHLSMQAREALEASGLVDLGAELTSAHYEFDDGQDAFNDIPSLVWLGRMDRPIWVTKDSVRVHAGSVARLKSLWPDQFTEATEFRISPNTSALSEPASRKVPEAFKVNLQTLIAEIRTRAVKKNLQFDPGTAPGQWADFIPLAHKWSDKLDYKVSSFKEYAKGILKFKRGKRSCSFYKDLFPEYFSESI